MAVFALGAAAVLGSAGSAAADSIVFTNPTAAGYGTFTSNGETVAVCDTRADGYGVNFFLTDRVSGALLGKGKAGGKGKCENYDFDLAEGRAVCLDVSLYKDGVIKDGSGNTGCTTA
ncbi:hypothetical protein [Streptomyces sp. S.PNR 29]|uniref:hypothetical protein n=1 Tax=Streptomyces sp. S.PNR 29 TaxID=2973805 RepID=UPI0025B0095B|nr:hypothetical protein [Streptomyces sp. S.PNR 29]MDN0199327.1 hypothetical protein [Streptomyces sp. S.PNR 29]